MRATTIAVAVIAVSSFCCPAWAQDNAPQPSFDCAASTQPVEALICADPTLADLDRALADAYQAALATHAGEEQAALRREQRAWAGNRTVACAVDAEPATEAESAIGCLIALYRGRLTELQPAEAARTVAVSQHGYGWLMDDWTIAAIRTAPSDASRGDAAKARLGQTLHFAEAPITTPGGATCSSPHYRAEPAPGPQFGDLTDYPAAVMVRITCVGIALFDVVRLTEDQILLGEGEVVFELERRR